MSAKNGAYNLSVHTKRHTHTKHAHTQQVFLGLALSCLSCGTPVQGFGTSNEGLHACMTMGGCACCLVIPPTVIINIMMWVFMFQSDTECGSSLWGYGIALLVLCVCVCGLNPCLVGWKPFETVAFAFAEGSSGGRKRGVV
jgi:hypothetical protein